MNPTTPTEGRRVTVRVGVYNRGDAPASPCIVEWWPGEEYRRPALTWRIEGLPAHGGRILTGVYDGYPSWYARLTTKAVVDASGAVREINEGNNAARRTIRVRRP